MYLLKRATLRAKLVIRWKGALSWVPSQLLELQLRALEREEACAVQAQLLQLWAPLTVASCQSAPVPRPHNRESLSTELHVFSFGWGNSEAIEGKKLFEQDFGDYTILLCVEWDSDIGWTNLDQFELRLISSDSCIWSKLKMWEKQKCEMWKVNQIDTNRAPSCTLPVQSVCPELNRSLASTLY